MSKCSGGIHTSISNDSPASVGDQGICRWYGGGDGGDKGGESGGEGEEFHFDCDLSENNGLCRGRSRILGK